MPVTRTQIEYTFLDFLTHLAQFNSQGTDFIYTMSISVSKLLNDGSTGFSKAKDFRFLHCFLSQYFPYKTACKDEQS